uniref:Candidate secreted effector n=1 Tax=Meloidogyne incognita TaxID=6306 RepID=A0A914M1N2_MELIC
MLVFLLILLLFFIKTRKSFLKTRQARTCLFFGELVVLSFLLLFPSPPNSLHNSPVRMS